MSSYYWRIKTPEDSLAYYVFANNAEHAVRMVNAFAGENLVNGRSRYVATQIGSADVPDGDAVLNEPEDLAEARLDGQE